MGLRFHNRRHCKSMQLHSRPHATSGPFLLHTLIMQILVKEMLSSPRNLQNKAVTLCTCSAERPATRAIPPSPFLQHHNPCSRCLSMMIRRMSGSFSHIKQIRHHNPTAPCTHRQERTHPAVCHQRRPQACSCKGPQDIGQGLWGEGRQGHRTTGRSQHLKHKLLWEDDTQRGTGPQHLEAESGGKYA